MTDRCRIIIDPADLLDMLVAYTNGQIPPSARLLEVGYHPHLTRLISLVTDSPDWTTHTPLQFRYEGPRLMTHIRGTEPDWQPTPDDV